MERLYREYSEQGVLFLHTLSGEGAHTVLDYQKHYRSAYPHVTDPVQALERQFNSNDWPFYLIADGKGRVGLRRKRHDRRA